MDDLNKALEVLRSTVKNTKPVAYWHRDNEYIFRTVSDGSFDCNYFIVKDSEVSCTNPVRSHLSVSDMKPL